MPVEAAIQLCKDAAVTLGRAAWVHDVTCDEDRSQVRCGNIPHVMAA